MASNTAQTERRLRVQSAWPTRRRIGDLLLMKEQQPVERFSPLSSSFLFVSLVALFLDPLYPFTEHLDFDFMQVYYNHSVLYPYMVYRTVSDLCYAVDTYISVRGIITSSNRKECSLSPLSAILHGLFRALPLPQVAISFKDGGIVSTVCISLLPFQYALRVAAYHKSAKSHYGRIANNEILRFLLRLLVDFLPFILAGHLFGSMWYYLGVDKIKRCWRIYACDGLSACEEKEECSSLLSSTHGTIFDLGMSPSRNIPRKMLQSFWWGFRNLSSFGSNLQTSWDEGVEITFSILVSVSGLLLFLLFWNLRVQEANRRSEDDKLRLAMQKLHPHIDLWMSQNGVSSMPGFISEGLKKTILKNVQEKFERKREFDAEDIFSLIPKLHRDYIMSLLGPTALRKVRMFEEADEEALEQLCKLLKPVMYAVDDCIIQEGQPIRKMLFIRQGTVWSYTTASHGRTSRVTAAVTLLKKGDVFGAELFDWASTGGSLSEFPVSTASAVAQTRVEAFVITANDLETFFSRPRRHFSPEERLEDWARRTIEAACLRHVLRRRNTARTAIAVVPIASVHEFSRWSKQS